MASFSFSSLFKILSFTLTLCVLFGSSWGQLTPGFYTATCPYVTTIVRSVVMSAVVREPRMGASLLRLHFLDCFVNGCDASVLLDDTETFTGEKTATQNSNSARGFDVIDTVKNQVERQCPGVVSCADILAAAAQASVVALGGQTWSILYGRRDSTTASLSDANSNIPSPTSNLTDLILSFSNKGFTTKEMVALSGAHTIGQARCTNFRDRIYNESNIGPSFAITKQSSCPSSGGDDNLSPLDATPISFDNRYYKKLMNKRGLLHSDQELYNGGSTDGIVKTYASNPITFFNDFGTAMVKMGSLGPLTGANGVIRRNCRRTN